MTRYAHWLLTAFILIGAIYHGTAKAETAIIAGGWSVHPFSNHEYTSSHDLIAIEHNDYMAARFRNSHGRESYAVSRGWHRVVGDWRLSGYLGAVRGYRICWRDDDSNNNTCPLIAGAAIYQKYRVQPGVLLMGEAIAIVVRVRL